MKNLVQIQSNCYINYANEEEQPIWHIKGTQMFNLYVPNEFLIEDEESCIEAFKLMLFEESSDRLRYEYVNFRIMWIEPKQLHDSTFLEKVQIASIISNCE